MGYRFFNKKITTQHHSHRFTKNSIDLVLNKTQNTKKKEDYQEIKKREGHRENEKIKPHGEDGVGRLACEGQHVEAAVEADSCGVEAVRLIVNMCGLWGMWSSCGGRCMKANGRCRMMEAGMCERE